MSGKRIRFFLRHARLNHMVGARWSAAIRVAWADSRRAK